MKELEDVARKYKSHELSLDEAKNQLVILIYNNPPFFGMEKMSKDTFHSFLLWAQKRIENILINFNSTEGSFSGYCRQSIFLCIRTFMKINAKDTASEESFINIAPMQEEENLYKYNENEYSLQCNSSCENIQIEKNISSVDFLNKYVPQKGRRWKYDVMIENLRKAACLILTLKSCCYVDADIVRKVSLVTNLKEEEIVSLLNQVKSKLNRKIKIRENCIKARDYAFFYRRRYMLETVKLNEKCSLAEKLIKGYEKQTEIWNRKNKQLKNHKYKAIPTNADLAEVLNVSDRRIAYILKTAKKNIDTISLKDYDINHETIFSNRK